MIWWLLLTGCAPTPTSWITPPGDVSTAVVQEDGRMLAYVCGNDEATRQVWSRWFEGSIDRDGFSAEADGWTLDGLVDGDVLELTLRGPSDEARDLTADAEEAAIYANDETCLDGAIASDGRVDGTWCDLDGVRFQVEPIETVVLGDTLTLAVPGGERVFQRQLP